MSPPKESFFVHLHPRLADPGALRAGYSWCAGGLAFFLFLVLSASGALLMWHYRPGTGHAFSDVVRIEREVPLGFFVRNAHRFGSDAMVAVVWLHMARVVLTGSYRPPRELNWVVGVLLLCLTMALAFTGYVLPWDRLAVSAATVGAGMLASVPLAGADGPLASWSGATSASDLRWLFFGGAQPAGPTLVRFFALHCFILPASLLLLAGWHFWRVRKDGFSEPL